MSSRIGVCRPGATRRLLQYTATTMMRRLIIARTHGFGHLVAWMSTRRKWQFLLLFLLTLAGALAELLAIGAVLPFLRLIVAPDALLTDARFAEIRAAFGWRSATDLVAPATLLLVFCAMGSAGVRLLLAWASQRFTYRLGYDMDAALFQRIVHQPYLSHVSRNSSEILAGFDKINMLTNSLLLSVMTGISSGVIAVCIIGLLVWIDPIAASVTAASIGTIYIGITMATRQSLTRVSETRARLSIMRMKAVREALGGLRDIIIHRSQLFHERRFVSINDKFRGVGAHAAIIGATPRYLVEGAGVALIGLLIFYLAGRPGGVFAALPVFGALILGAQRLLPLLQASYQGFVQYLAARASLADVLRLLAGPMIDPTSAAKGAPTLPFAREIALHRLGFHYPDGTAALVDIDLTIARGARIGLVGRTGSGKSTLVDVLLGLLPPDAGAILLDGVPLAHDRIGGWQAQIAHVPQTIFLADDSVAANIAFGEAGEVDMARIEDAARRACMHDTIVALPEGYRTMVGERGVRLSGGQRQRIGIARALYKRAAVLVLDEATSALDDATEAAIMAELDRLGRDLTIVMIAHRLTTLTGCDTLYRLEGGRIVAQGDYATVVAGNGG
jgi:ABC-type multidrug transport system fused ATPase/permease subunit